MGLRDVAHIIDADMHRMVRAATWGHLAPKRGSRYSGRVVFSCGVYDSGDLNPTILVTEFPKLPNSPWECEAMEDLARALGDAFGEGGRDEYSRRFETGRVYEFLGVFRNYRFEGVFQVLMDLNKVKAPLGVPVRVAVDLRKPDREQVTVLGGAECQE